jgi:shikimate dehydrogenase
MLKITGQTKLLGIFGDPVSHTLSPLMQNAALHEAGIDAVYLPFHIRSDQLAAAVNTIRTLSLIGVNVTVPHKEKIIPFLDAIDPDAALIGAVNTVVNRGGFLTGFNTDAPGFLSSLRQDLGIDPATESTLIIGAGGACRAALTALAGCGVKKIVIANRTRQKAEMLAEEIQRHFPATVFLVSSMLESELSVFLQGVDLLVNSTTVGLSGDSFPDFLVDRLPVGASVYDMVYAEKTTPLIHAARLRGLNCTDGRGMLIAQGEAAFFKWFDMMPAKNVMGAQVIEKQSIF